MMNQPRQKEKELLIVVTGPTASGKTRFAAVLASQIGGEVISADSRQVYRGMDLGTGKDIADYEVDGVVIPAHLIDITDPGEPYNVYAFQQDFIRIYQDIVARRKTPVLCGGSGLYVEAVLKGYRLIEVPPDPAFRAEAAQRTDAELIAELSSLAALHNSTDTENRKRLVRALEIARYYKEHPQHDVDYPAFHPVIFGVRFDRSVERERITARLKARLESGMIEEVKALGELYGWERMEYFGLEYKVISLYLKGETDYETMFSSLNTAIHQFAKRQMTWFRRMERNGTIIHWIPGEWPLEEKLGFARKILESDGNL